MGTYLNTEEQIKKETKRFFDKLFDSVNKTVTKDQLMQLRKHFQRLYNVCQEKVYLDLFRKSSRLSEKASGRQIISELPELKELYDKFILTLPAEQPEDEKEKKEKEKKIENLKKAVNSQFEVIWSLNSITEESIESLRICFQALIKVDCKFMPASFELHKLLNPRSTAKEITHTELKKIYEKYIEI